MLPTPRALSGLVAACWLLVCAAPATADAATPGTVDLQGREVTPGAEAAADARSGESLADTGDQLVVVRYERAVGDAIRAQLSATGARIVTYLADDAYLVHASGPSAARLARLVRASASVDGGFVLDGADKLPQGFPARGRVRVAVQTLNGEDGAGARAGVARSGDLASAATAVGPYRTQVVTIEAAAARRLAADPGVVAIEREGTPVPLDERQGLIMADGALGAEPGAGYLAAHDARGRLGHLPLRRRRHGLRVRRRHRRPRRRRLPRRRRAVRRGSRGLRPQGDLRQRRPALLAGVRRPRLDQREHRGGLRGGQRRRRRRGRRGLPLRARRRAARAHRRHHDLRLQRRLPRAVRHHVHAARVRGVSRRRLGHDGARVGSNSWGVENREGEYTRYAQEYDAIVRDAVPAQAGNQEMVQVFAAGNDGPGTGSIAPPATAKNVIAVGASENVRPLGTDGCLTTDDEADDAQDVPGFTSRGPTDDGRLKPDLVAPGTHVAGSIWRDTPSPYDGTGVCGAGGSFGAPFPGAPGYTASSGTSHATPAVAALAAAARVVYEGEHGTWPSPAMVKAMLIAGATPLTGAGAGEAPNPVQGHGLARLGSVSTAGRVVTDQDAVLRDTGDNAWREATVADEGRPVVATLVWTDAPGPLLGAAQVNDLDLELVVGADVYRGNSLSGGVTPPGGAADRLNNVERVVLPAGISGPVIARVRAATIAGDGVPGGLDATDQDFALLLENVTVPPGGGWYGVPDPPQPPGPPQPPAPDPQPQPQPEQAPAPAAPEAPATAKPRPAPRLRVSGAPSSKRCLTVGGAKLRVKAPAGMRLTSISVLVDRRLRARTSGAKLRSTLRVRFTRRRAHTLRIVARTTTRTTLRWERRYKACTPAPAPVGSGGSIAP